MRSSHLILVLFLVIFYPLPSFYLSRLNNPHRMKTKNTRVKCLYDCILNYLAVIQSRLNARIDFIPHWYMPTVRGMPNAKQLITPKQCSEQFMSTIDSTVLPMTCAEAICLFFSIRNPALLQSSQYIHRMPQKCWYCQANMYMNIAKGQTMQILLPEAAHPKQTGSDPIKAPTNVFISDCCFILVQMNKQLTHMDAPIPAVRGLQAINPARPAIPSPAPSPNAMLGLTPFTKGLWEVRIILRSSSTSIYWLRACVDIESATDEARSGKQEEATGQREYAPIVTIPLSNDSLNLVNSRPCLNILLLSTVEIIALLFYVNIINIV